LLADASVRLAGAGEAGRVAVLDLLRARTRRFEVVLVVGLDEGRLPRRSQGSPFLDEEQKAELERSSRTGRLLRTDPVSRDRYLFYTACTRPTRRLYLVREAASDDGAPREPSPFWDETRGLYAPDEVERWTRRRPLAALTWPLEAAPSERERLRACLAEALAAHVRFDLPELERNELAQGLARDLEKLIRREAESESPLVPSRFEVSFGSERSAPELQRGLELGGFAVSGKIDRIDRDPFGARGVVVDYKSGKTAHSARRIESELHLQIPLYMLVLRDLVGIEPLGGVYRALAGEGQARGLLREEAREDGLPGYSRNDYVDEDAFWGQIDRAQEHARDVVERIRAGGVRHDPKGGFPCPTWCDLWSMCRVKRS